MWTPADEAGGVLHTLTGIAGAVSVRVFIVKATTEKPNSLFKGTYFY